jgi:hypothetical protein
MTKGKAPTSMMMTQLHEEQREAIVVAEIHHRTPRVKGVILHHPHQATPMAAAVAVAAQPGHVPLKKIRRTRSHTTRVPLKRDCQVPNSLLPCPEVLWTTDS